MKKIKLRFKDKHFKDEVENKKDFICYNNVSLYANSDIPMRDCPVEDPIVTPDKLWDKFDPTIEDVDANIISINENVYTYEFRAKHCNDGDLRVEVQVYMPAFPSRKAVLLISEYDDIPQDYIIKKFLSLNCYVIVPDYNGKNPDTQTVFPNSLRYGKHLNEGSHLTKLSPGAKDTCQYLYTLINRRVIRFFEKTICEENEKKNIIVIGIRQASEIAMMVAGLEREKVCALGAICGAGFPEFTDIPRYDKTPLNIPDGLLNWIISCSGISYINKYDKPFIIALGSNGTYSDIDRISNIAKIIKEPPSVFISSQCTDNIDLDTFNSFALRIDYAFFNSEFPNQPISKIDFNKDGTVYVNITVDTPVPVKKTKLYYSYGNNNHKTRNWHTTTGETIGLGEYLAKLSFTHPAEDLFYYSEITYLNGMTVTEIPKYSELDPRTLKYDPTPEDAFLYIYGQDNLTDQKMSQLSFSDLDETKSEIKFKEISSGAISIENSIEEATVPSGAKGIVCKKSGIQLFIGDKCKNITPEKLLQIDAYCEEKNYTLEISIISGNQVYTSSRFAHSQVTFEGEQFKCTDFKTQDFKPLQSWQNVKLLSILTPNVVINKILFI